MPTFAWLLFGSLLLLGCSGKGDLSADAAQNIPEGFPRLSDPVPQKLIGRWTRTTRLQTFDFKPNEWVTETTDASSKKYLIIQSDKTYSSNYIPCTSCKVAWSNDTLYLQHSTGVYKFPVMALGDSVLHLKTNINIPVYSLPNTGLFDFVLEEQYRKSN